jgi:hypothetical protein
MAELFKQGHDKIKRWSFSADFGRDFEELFNLQMCCLGLDIRMALELATSNITRSKSLHESLLPLL